MSEYWEIIPEKSKEHWLEVKEPDGWYSAIAKWDGCIDYYRYYNTPLNLRHEDGTDVDSIHICDIDEEIARLQSLKRIAANWFTGHGQSEYWQAETVEGALVNPLQVSIEASSGQ